MSRNVYILGVSMSNHDRSACLLRDGRIVAAISEDRLDRRKGSEGFYSREDRGIVLPPMAAITYVLRKESIGLDEVELVVCGRSITSCRDTLVDYVPVPASRVIEPSIPGHHLAHAYSAYGTSPFKDSAVLVIDEQGHHLSDQSFEKCSWFETLDGRLSLLERFTADGRNDLSLGMFFNAFAALTGLAEAGRPAAGKLMGLAPFGKRHSDWPDLISLKPERGNTFIPLKELDAFFTQIGLPIKHGMEGFMVQSPDDLLAKYLPIWWKNELAADLACKAQDELEKAVLHIQSALRRRSRIDVLSYSGGVALNCKINQKLLESGWADVYIHPAATDDGAAVGLALYGWIDVLGHAHEPLRVFNPFTGYNYCKTDISRAISHFGLSDFASESIPWKEGVTRVARGEIVCWFNGESEWGPRALGARSIIANPLITGIKRRINSTIKFREPFRPFGISVTRRGFDELLDTGKLISSLSRYMLVIAEGSDSRLLEVRHVDGTVRFQLVDQALQPEWHRLIEEFGERTGLYAVINTSFNTLGEPIVESPLDAVRQFLLSGADSLLLGSTLLVADEISAEVMETARAMAWEMTPIDPLGAALGLEAAGYSESGLNLLNLSKFDAKTALALGPSAMRKYHAFMQRVSIQREDTNGAVHHSEKVLQWSGLGMEALEASTTYGRYSSGDNRKQCLGNLLAAIAGDGEAFKFFESVL